MIAAPTTAGRLRRPAVALVLLLLALLRPVPSLAAGTGGVDISPYPGIVDGKQITAFHAEVPSRGSETVRYALRNTTAKPATARLYQASAARNNGTFTIGTAGSSPYLSFPDEQITLTPHETRLGSFTVHPGPDGRPGGTAYGALVVEVKNGSIVQQAATVVYLKPGRTVPLPLLIVLVAAGALVLMTIALYVVRRRRS